MGLSLPQLLRCSMCGCAAALVFGVPLLAQTREVIIDNAKIRVLREVVGPGETTEYDNPRLDRVVVWLQEGNGETLLPDGEVKNVSWTQYEAKWEPADTSHPIGLKGRNPVTLIVVELKRKGGSQKAPASPQNPWLVDPNHYKIEFENEGVRVSRVNIGPKESTPLHEHSLDRVVVYLTGLDFQIDPEGNSPVHSVQEPGAVVWSGPARHTEHNLSDRAFEAVVIEPKY